MGSKGITRIERGDGRLRLISSAMKNQLAGHREKTRIYILGRTRKKRNGQWTYIYKRKGKTNGQMTMDKKLAST